MKDVVAGAFRGLGVGRSAAKWMSRLLQGEVTDSVCRLLPGAAGVRTGAGRWLTMASFALPPAIGPLATQLVPAVDKNRAHAAALPTVLMLGIGKGLLDRPGAGAPAPLAPAPALHGARREAEALVQGELGTYLEEERARAIRARLGQFMREAMGNTDGVDWGGWTMLAALEAMRQHGDVLPEPGRQEQSPGARMAGRSFRLGRALAYAVALDLIAYAEAYGGRGGAP
ncbi:hypothetical protein ACIPSA_27530 [Streptomyces sp. NPDC086549]|uniref:hypothetical protein n=1 Tax=Streptomyces sp. NPDC086549 TaxID=3365752 RepID=UPI00381786FF